MRLIHTKWLEFQEFFDTQLPKYAMLSHCWANNEVTYQDFLSGAKRDGEGRQKIVKCCQIACRGNLDWAWVDKAINSMYRWYQEAEVCYVLLPDYCSAHEYPPSLLPSSGSVPQLETSSEHIRQTPNHPGLPLERTTSPNIDATITAHSVQVVDPEAGYSAKLAESRWFTRGWTLQELLAPRVVLFYDRSSVHFGSKESLAEALSKVTGIGIEYLRGESNVDTASVSCRMSWASKRQTTRKEDIAYCLLGLFDINMPLLYGEGAGAFQRLQEEIIARNDDHTIFTWTTREQDGVLHDQPSSLLARSPEYFWDGASFMPTSRRPPPSRITGIGIEVSFPRNLFIETITFGQWRDSLAGFALPFACSDIRWTGRFGRPYAQISIRKQARTSLSVPGYYRFRTANVSPAGMLWRSNGIAEAFVGARYTSVYIQRLQSASGQPSTIEPGTGPGFAGWRWVWLGLLIWIGIILLQSPFAAMDRDVVRFWASFGILLLLSSQRMVYLLAIIGASYIPLTSALRPGSGAWLAAITIIPTIIGFSIFPLQRPRRPVPRPHSRWWPPLRNDAGGE